MFNQEMLEKIIKTPSPSGREDQLIKLIVDERKNVADDIIYDHQGSATIVYNKEVDFKVMLAAHADEISLIVNGYNSNGSLTVDRNGGIKPQLYVGTKVRVITENKVYHGVVGVNKRVVNNDKLSCEDLFIDLGFNNAEEAKKMIPLGSYIIHDTDLVELENDLIAARAFDDRLGVFITQEAALKAKELGSKVGIYATMTTGEENTGRGAYSSSSIIKPDLSVIVDVTYANDYIGSDIPGDIALGEGGVICLGSIPNRKLNDLLKSCADKLNLKVQYEVWSGRTCTDGDTILKTNQGNPVVLFSIPLRYMHSPVEVVSKKDIESMIEILALFLVEISENYSLKPYSF